MAEIAMPLNATPLRMQRTTVLYRLRTLTAPRPARQPSTASSCFGRMGAKDAMVARGLTAAAIVGQGGPQQ